MYRNTMGTMPNLQNYNGNDADLNTTETKCNESYTETIEKTKQNLKINCKTTETN